MPLQKQMVTVPVLGLDTHVDPKTAPPGALTTALNVNYRRTAQGALEVIKRNGFTARTTTTVQGGAVASGRKLGSFNDEQLMLGDALYSWSTAETKWVQRVTKNLPACTLTATPVGANPKGVTTTWDLAVGGGLQCTVWSQGLNQPARVVITDATTGAHVLDQDLTWSVTAGVLEIRVVALVSVFMIVASFSSSQVLASRTIAYATPTTISSEVSITAALNSSPQHNRWDMVRPGANDWALVAYYSATPNTTVVRWNSNQTSGGSGSAATVADQGIGWLTWDASDGNMYLVFTTLASGTFTHTVNASTAAVAAATLVDAALKNGAGITGYRTGTTNVYFAGVFGTPIGINSSIVRSTGGAFSAFQLGLFLGGKPFLVAGRYYLPASNGDSGVGTAPTNGIIFDQRTLFVLDVTDGTAFASPVVAKAFYGESRGPLFTICALPAGGFLSATKYAMPALRTIVPTALIDVPNPTFDTSVTIQGMWQATLDFTIPGCSPMTTQSENLYLPGAAIKEYDGFSCAEAGFHSIPIAPTLAVGGTATLLQSSLYQACVVWVYTDDRGATHYSAPSQAAPINLGVGQTSFTATCQTYRFGERAGNLMIELYITQAAGTTFYLAARAANVTSADTVLITLTGVVTNTSIAQQPALYTSDGTLGFAPFPPARLMCSYRNRMIFSGTEDNCDVWVSNERATGFGLSISDANIVQVDKEGGGVTALAEFDDRVIIFKRTAVFEMSGSGPAANGTGGFDTPNRLSATVGCIAPESIVKTPQGLMFQSARGFYMLPTGGGQPVRVRAIETLEALTVTGAVNLDALEQTRFVTASGTTLVYHYGFLDEQGMGRWSTHTTMVAVDCALYNGGFVWLAANGVVQVENGAWDDNGAAVQMQIVFAWLNLASLYGRHRLYRTAVVADWLASTTVTARQSVNFDATVAQTATAAATVSSMIPLVIINARGDAYSHRFTVEETSTTQGFRLSALVLELAGKGAGAKALVGQTFT